MVNPDLLQSFLAVAEVKSFTLAAQRLGLRQSTVSQHVKRLEAAVQRPLLARDTHSVALTPDGDAMVDFAHSILDGHERMARHFAGSELHGRLRLGVSEDFVLFGLPDVLFDFSQRHSSVDLELVVGLSGVLYDRFDAGDLDVIFIKRRAGDTRGQVAWREQLVWVGRPGVRLDPQFPVPLVLFPPPSITRALALDAVERARRPWRIACTSDGLSGIHAAAMAGLGVAAHSARLIPDSLAVIPPGRGLPELGQVEFVVIGPGPHNRIAAALTAMILQGAARLQQKPAAVG